MRVRVGSLEALQKEGRLVGKAWTHGVCVFWHDGKAYALDDRCPHMGFPLHRGSVEAGLVTCHWHHARFDLASGCTFDLWADDALALDVAAHKARQLDIPAALNNSFGFGGHNVALVFTRA